MLKLATKFIPERHAFETAWRAGFRYAEFWLDENLLDDWQVVAEMAADYPLDYVLHFPNRKKLEPQHLDCCVRLYEALNCRAMVIHRPMFDQFGAGLLERKPDIILAVENHRLDPAAFDAWANENEYLTLDVEHVWMFTLPDAALSEILEYVERFLDRFADKLRHVHMPGYVPGYDEHRPMYCSRDMVFGVMSLLEKIGFGGFVVSEVNSEYQNELDLRMDRLLFDRWRESRSMS